MRVDVCVAVLTRALWLQWGDQDGNGPGKVIALECGTKDWIRIAWDNGNTNNYRVGAEDAFDLIMSDVAGPGDLVTINSAKEGMRVARGPDWKWGDQDGHGLGTIVGLDCGTKGWIRVKWDAGETNNYRVVAECAYDLVVAGGAAAAPPPMVPGVAAVGGGRPTVGDMVRLRPGVDEGCLRGGKVGKIIKDEHDHQPYHVDCGGDTYWSVEGGGDGLLGCDEHERLPNHRLIFC